MMDSDSDILKRIEERRKVSLRDLSSQYARIAKCQAFVAGDVMAYKDTIQFQGHDGQKKRAVVSINKVKPYISAVKGFFAQNRRKPKYVAQMEESPAQQLYSKYANALSEHCRASMNADQVETQMDGDMLIGGIAVAETAMSYGDGYASRGANGEIVMSCLDVNSFWWDPAARETNLLDARWMGVTKEYDKDDALELFMESKPEDFEGGGEEGDSGYAYDPSLGGSYDRVKYDWADEKANLVKVHFYQEYKIEKYWRAQNPLYSFSNPETVQAVAAEMDLIKSEVEDDDFDPRAEILSFGSEVKKRLEETLGEYIEPEEFRKKCFYTHISSGKTLFKSYKNPNQGGFSLKVKTGDYDAKNKVWTGLVDSMMEPQTYYNKALTELMFIIAANSKGGVIVEEDAIEDIDEFSANYARTDAVCVVRPGALAAGKIQDKKKPFAPTGYEQIIQLADAAIADTAGIDRTFLGSSENKQETAMLQRQRIRQVVSSLACYVDAIGLYQKEHARLMLDLMRVFAENNQGSLVRILGDNGADEFMKVSADHLASDYFVVIEDAPTTPEEKQEMAAILTGMGDKFLTVGDATTAKVFYSMAVKYLQVAPEDKQNILKSIAPSDQEVDPAYVKQLEAAVQQLQSQMTQEQLKNIASTTALNIAKVKEVNANIQKKAAETSKTLEDAEKISMETKLSQSMPVESVNVNL